MEEQVQGQELEVIGAVVISLKSNGLITIDSVEGAPNIGYEATEDLIRRAYQRMVENRIVSNSVTALLQAQAAQVQGQQENEANAAN
jgi:hypothetical protein